MKKQYLKSFSDCQLFAQVKRLAVLERKTGVEIVFHLAEVDRRKAFVAPGYSSLFDYCTRELGYSEGAAMRRINAARLLLVAPEAGELLLSGELSLTTASMLKRVVCEENAAEVLCLAAGKSRDEVELVVARFAPAKAKTVERIAPVVQRKAVAVSLDSLFAGSEKPQKQLRHRGDGDREDAVQCDLRYDVKFSISKEKRELLAEAQRLHGSHRVESLFEEMLELYLDKHCPVRRCERRVRRKSAVVRKPSEKKLLRHIPAGVKDAVLVRDGQQCSYVSPEGVRCSCRENLEIDHVKPFGLGGESSEENCRLLCRAHNFYFAEHTYGKEYMRQFVVRE